MTRLFLDANVIFSAAHNPEGNSRALFKLAGEQWIELVSSRYALEEAVRNIAVKFPERIAELGSLAAGLTLVGEAGEAPDRLAAACGLPDKDVPILAAAIAAGASVLVTGDRRDFGHLYGKSIEGVLVLTPAQALSKVLDSRVKK